jgi:hypothetical protein
VVGPLAQFSNSKLEDQGMTPTLWPLMRSCLRSLRSRQPSSLGHYGKQTNSPWQGSSNTEEKNVVVSYTRIYSLFNDDSSSWNYLTSWGMIINDWWIGGRTEDAFVDYVKSLSWCLPEGPREVTKILQTIARFTGRESIWEHQVRIVTGWASMHGNGEW